MDERNILIDHARSVLDCVALNAQRWSSWSERLKRAAEADNAAFFEEAMHLLPAEMDLDVAEFATACQAYIDSR